MSIIIIAKIIIRLINYYINIDLDDFNKDTDIYLKKILKENKDFVKGDINIFNELGLNFDEKYFIKTELDIIYSDIILAFLKKQILYDIKYESLILIQLELKSIKLTNNIIEKLSKELNVENKNFKKYKIKNEKDLYNEEVINFYYFLLKFIFKNNIFIYHIHFLLNFRIIIIKLINGKTILKLNEDNKDKLEYIIKRITDSDYYFNKYLKYNIFEPLKSILKYYKNYLFESKKEEINSIEKIIKNNTNDKTCTKYLQDYEKAQIMNQKFPIINFFFLQKNNNIEKTENELNDYVNIWENIEKKIKENKLNEIKGLLIVKEEVCQSFCKLRFSNSGRTYEQKRAKRACGVIQASPVSSYCVANDLHGLILPDNPLMKHIFKLYILLLFASKHFCNGNSSPCAYDAGNIFLRDLLP